MPVSGSYHYPQVQVANSSFPNSVLREVTSAPGFGLNLGKLFVSASDGNNALFFQDEDGNVTNLELGASASLSLEITGAGNFFVDDRLDVSGSIVNPVGHLILSSSDSSTIHVSGNMQVRESLVIGPENVAQITIGGLTFGSNVHVHKDGDGDLASVVSHRHTDTSLFGGHMVLGKSRGTEASPTVVVENDKIARIFNVGYDGTDYEIASEINTSIDGAVGNNSMPGRLEFWTRPSGSAAFITERYRIDSNGQLVAPSGHFILSSSAGSTITVSGTLQVLSGSGDVIVDGGSIIARGGLIYNDTGDLIVSSSAGNVVLSGTLVSTEAPDFSEITAQSSHLILSSSAGSKVYVSGNLEVGGNIVGTAGQIAEVALTGASVTANLTADAYAAVTGAFETGEVVGDFVVDETGSISYVGTEDITVQMQGSVSAIAGAANSISTYAFAKNGVPLEKTKIERKHSNNTDVGAAPFQGVTTMTQGDSVRAENALDATSTLKVERMNIFIRTV
jgi:hypothetical protein